MLSLEDILRSKLASNRHGRHVAASFALGVALHVSVGLAPLASASTVFALVDTGELFASTDGGGSWSVLSVLPVSDAADLIAASTASELVLVSQTGAVYRSLDAGVSWNAVGGISASDVVDLAGRTDGALLALTRTGVLWLSTDDGVSFSPQAALNASDFVSMGRGTGNSLFALTATGTVRRSDDGGVEWITVGVLPVSDAVSIRCAGAAHFVLTDAGLVYESLDQAETWSAVGTVSQVGMRGLLTYGSDLVALHRTGLTARSADGVTWDWVGAVNQVAVVAVASDVPQAVSVPTTPGETPRLVVAPPRPNPLRAGSAVHVGITLPISGRLGMSLFDAGGRRVAARSTTVFDAGSSVVSWELPRLPTGVYFLKLVSDTQAATTRVVVID